MSEGTCKDYCEMCYKNKSPKKNAFFYEIKDLNKNDWFAMLEICRSCAKKIVRFVFENSHKKMQEFQRETFERVMK